MPGNDPVITLTTDFGYSDPFVGVMKGVVLKINPRAVIVDLNHGIAPQNVKEAAFSLGASYGYFPDHTIHVVVVDPGVGSSRRAVLVSVDNQLFIGPDNGVFSYVYELSRETPRVIHITASHYFLSSESPTFQARDLFAPVAAWLSRGIGIANFGDYISDYQKFEIPRPRVASGGPLSGEVVHIDRFGNAITNVRKSDIDGLCGNTSDPQIRTTIKDREVLFKRFYSEAQDGGLYSLMNSSGYLELFVNGGNASILYKISTGDKVEVRSGRNGNR